MSLREGETIREDDTAPKLEQGAKRILEATAATVILIILSPLLLFTAIAIKLNSHGPVFVRDAPARQVGQCRGLRSCRTTPKAGGRAPYSAVGTVSREPDNAAILISLPDHRLSSAGLWRKSPRRVP